jgi:hypothetical protein
MLDSNPFCCIRHSLTQPLIVTPPLKPHQANYPPLRLVNLDDLVALAILQDWTLQINHPSYCAPGEFPWCLETTKMDGGRRKR